MAELLTAGKMSTGEHKTSDNGVAVFTVEDTGRISREPVAVRLESGYARLENVQVTADRCVLTDPVRGQVTLYDLNGSGLPDKQLQVISDHLSFPHDACIAPDSKTLLVSNYGLRVENEKPLWHEFTDPRTDSVSVFRLS